MSRYSIFDSTIKTLFDKIRAKTGKTEKMSFTEAGEAVDSIKSADGKPYIDTSQITDFSYFFYNGARQEMVDRVDTSNGTNFYSMFYKAGVTSVDLDTKKGTNFSDMFSLCQTIRSLHLTYLLVEGRSIQIYDSTNLKDLKIDKIKVRGNSLSFVYCNKLSHESLVGVLNACEDNSELSETYHITLGSTNLAKLSAEEQAIATNKNIELR